MIIAWLLEPEPSPDSKTAARQWLQVYQQSMNGKGPERDKCDSCGADDEGLHLAEYEDPGDPSVGYGPITELLCDDCAEHLGLR